MLFLVCAWHLTAVYEFVEFVVVKHSDQPVKVPEHVADLIGQLAGTAVRAPAGQARGGRSEQTTIGSLALSTGQIRQAIDAPFGWPSDFLEFVTRHPLGEPHTPA